MGQNTALEIATNLALDEASDGSTRGSGAREERLHILADDAMKESALGLVAFVANRGVVAGTGLVFSLLGKRYAAWGGGDGHGWPCPVCISPPVRCRAIVPSR